MKLTGEQLAIVDAWGQGIAVVAGAGCGKTSTMTAKLLRLTEKKPQARFIAVSFTERSANDLLDKLSQAIDPASLAQHQVTTIHGLCLSICRDYPIQSGWTGQERVMSELEADEVWSHVLEDFWTQDDAELDAALESELQSESRQRLENLLRRARTVLHFGLAGSSPSTRALLALAGKVHSRYQTLKRSRGLADFDDIEAGAKRALDDADVARFFHKNFDLVVVDEFQDTNPVQAELLWKLVKSDLSNLCVVGDPKQSIYRFRDADVSLFEERCGQLPIQLKLSLNFRSQPEIIQFVNQICSPVFQGSSLRYDPLEAGVEVVAGRNVEIVRASDENAWAQALKKSDYFSRAGTKALLLRKMRGNEHWLQALDRAQVPYALQSGGMFWENPTVRELVAFLRWWAQPANELSGATFLRAPWVGTTDQELDEWILSGQGLWKSFWNSKTHPWRMLLEKCRTRTVRPGDLLLEVIAGAPVIEVEALGLWHRAEELSYAGYGFLEIAETFTRCIREGRRERDIPPDFESSTGLSVLTIHASKGLEFDHVMLVDFEGKSRAQPTALLWDRSGGAYWVNEESALTTEWKLREAEKNLAESKRLFYVALTRARHSLSLVLPERESHFELNASQAVLEDSWKSWIEHFGVPATA